MKMMKILKNKCILIGWERMYLHVLDGLLRWTLHGTILGVVVKSSYYSCYYSFFFLSCAILITCWTAF